MTSSIAVTAEQAQPLFDRALSSTKQEFGSFFLARLLGFEISYGDERCTVAFEARRLLFNPQGSLHGGVLATAMDISMGHLLHHVAAPGATLEMKVQFLKPVLSGLVRCEASFLRRGRSLSFLQSAATDAGGDLIAHATATWKLLKKS